jgi:predicted peptidase
VYTHSIHAKQMKTHSVVLLLTVILVSVENKAQTAGEIYAEFSKGYYTYQGVTLPFYFFIPRGYDSSKEYPLVLCLHGSGEKGDNPSAVENNSMAVVWARDSNQTRWPCFILVPQCPTNSSWVHLYGPGSYNTSTIPISTELLAVLHLLDSLTTGHAVDTSRVYVTGLSMGGFATWDLIARFPDRFAAAIPMSGAGDTSRASLMGKMAIWDFHGALDNVIPVAGSREMMHALEAAGDTVVYTHCRDGDCTGLPDAVIAQKIKSGAMYLYTEYQYGQHGIWDNAYNTPLLMPWFYSKSKANRVVAVQSATSVPVPTEMESSQNYPNPFNPSTRIQFSVPTRSRVRLTIFNLLGQQVAELANEEMSAGSFERIWNANVASGLYFYRLEAVSVTDPSKRFVDVKKMILLK